MILKARIDLSEADGRIFVQVDSTSQWIDINRWMEDNNMDVLTHVVQPDPLRKPHLVIGIFEGTGNSHG
jgi:hypothetical protein